MTTHDVRKLHVCSECGCIGIYADAGLANEIDAPILVSNGPRKYICPRHVAIDALAVKSCRELGEIRMCDVDARTLETILLVMKNRAENTELPGIERQDC